MKQHLAAANDMLVVEFDTLLDRTIYPQASEWLTIRDILGNDVFITIQREIFDALEFYLRARPEIGDQTGDCELRKASMTGAFLDGAYTQLMSEMLLSRLQEKYRWTTIVVTAGCGVHFDFWRQTATANGMSVDVLQPEPFRRSFRRWLTRWYHKRLAKRAEKLPQQTPLGVRASTNSPLVACASKRVSKLLKSAEMQGLFRLTHLTAEDLGPIDSAVIHEEKQRQTNRWNRWQDEVLAKASIKEQERFGRFKPLYAATGIRFHSEVYPRWYALKKTAKDWLNKHRPDVILSDTQMAEEESIWTLAALELGIPVIAYTYDSVINAKIMNTPEYVLVDGMRSIPRALENGYPIERMINVSGHRRPSVPCRTSEETEAIFATPQPQVIYADSMSVAWDPQASLRSFRSIVEAARKLPHLRFIIKFHPLRAAKTELRCFVGMDESEVQAKTRFIKEMNPPRNVTILAPEANMEEQLKSAAVLLNTLSMSGHQAFQLGIPVVFMMESRSDFITFPELHRWLDVPQPQNGSELAAILEKLLTSRDYRQNQIERQKRYLDEYYWSSTLSLEEGISQALNKLHSHPRQNS